MVSLPYRKNPLEGSFTATKLRGFVFTDDIPSESQDLSIVYALHKLFPQYFMPKSQIICHLVI